MPLVSFPIKVINFRNYRTDSYFIRNLTDASELMKRLHESHIDVQCRFDTGDPLYEGWWFKITYEEDMSFFCMMVEISTANYAHHPT